MASDKYSVLFNVTKDVNMGSLIEEGDVYDLVRGTPIQGLNLQLDWSHEGDEDDFTGNLVVNIQFSDSGAFSYAVDGEDEFHSFYIPVDGLLSGSTNYKFSTKKRYAKVIIYYPDVAGDNANWTVVARFVAANC